MEPGIKPNEVEVLMQRFPQVFKQELYGIGANMERRWQFSGFNVYRTHWLNLDDWIVKKIAKVH